MRASVNIVEIVFSATAEYASKLLRRALGGLLSLQQDTGSIGRADGAAQRKTINSLVTTVARRLQLNLVRVNPLTPETEILWREREHAPSLQAHRRRPLR